METRYGQTVADPRRETALEDIRERSEATAKTLSLIIERFGMIADRALGDPPPSGAGGPASVHPVRSGQVGSIVDTLEVISSQLSSLQVLASRLEALA